MSLFSRFRDGLTRTRERLVGQVGGLLQRRGPPDPATLASLEEALLAADVGPATTERLLERAQELLQRSPGLDLRGALEQAAAALLGRCPARRPRCASSPRAGKPWWRCWLA